MAGRGDDMLTDTGTAQRLEHRYTPDEDVLPKSVGVSPCLLST